MVYIKNSLERINMNQVNKGLIGLIKAQERVTMNQIR